MKRKGLLLVMVVIMCISFLAGINGFAFSDVEEDHRHISAITYLTEKNVINGYGDGTFKPDDTITRAEFLKMALESVKISDVYGDTAVTTGFTDVDGKITKVKEKDSNGKEVEKQTVEGQHWAAGYIKLAVDKGVVNGYGDGTFKPDDPVSYEEAIKMIVCVLGREEQAKNKATSLKLNLWPDGYLSVGNELMISKSTDFVLGADATRSNVAQMLYNVKDVKVVVSSNVIIDDGTNKKPTFVGGGGSGSGGFAPPVAPVLPMPGIGGVTDSTTEVSGLIVYGKVVAAVKQVNGMKKPITIDNGIVIDNELINEAGNNYIIMKLETPIGSNNYQRFHTGGNDFSSYLGHRVEMKYKYNPDGGVGGRYEIENVSSRDTDVVYIDSANLKREKTEEKNQGTGNVVLCHTDGNKDYDQSLYTNNLNSLTVIYNNKLVDTTVNPLNLYDFMPDNGRVTLVDANMDSTIDVAWIESYETYVVGSRNFGTTPKSITDKFRKDATGQALKLELIEMQGTLDVLNVMQNGKEIEVTDIVNNMLLTVAQSKCGTSTDINAQRSSTASIVLSSVKSVSGVKKAFTAKNGTSYELSDYFINFVDSTLDYESGDSLALYLNSKNEVVWATVSEPTYSVGYLVRASYDENLGLTLRILTSSGSISKYTLADKFKYTTKTTEWNKITDENGEIVRIVEPIGSNYNGDVYKNINEGLVLASLAENAAAINDGKSSSITLNATYAQPIRYSLDSGSEIANLLTLEPDVENLFKDDGGANAGTKLEYYGKNANGQLVFNEYNMTDDGEYVLDEWGSKVVGEKSFSAKTSATVFFIPNNRNSENSYFKMGTFSSLSSKFVENMVYNIEPYIVTTLAGVPERAVFVVYNEDVDRKPTYRSDNIVISNIEDVSTANNSSFVITGYVGSISSTKKYTCYGDYPIKNAYVLDENFKRTGETREISVGDVIRVGTSPIGSVATIDLIFDISVDKKDSATKITAVSNENIKLSPTNPNPKTVHYYTRIGEITDIDSSNIPEFCKIRMPGENAESMVNIGSGYNSKQILLYDHTAVDEPATEKDDRLKIVKMEDLWGGEVLYVWQGANLLYKQIYAVRYPTTQTPPTSGEGDTTTDGDTTTGGDSGSDTIDQGNQTNDNLDSGTDNENSGTDDENDDQSGDGTPSGE